MVDRICPRCGKEVSPASRFCGNCGYQMDGGQPEPAAARICPNCGSEVPAESKFCTECGTWMDEGTVQPQDPGASTGAQPQGGQSAASQTTAPSQAPTYGGAASWPSETARQQAGDSGPYVGGSQAGGQYVGNDYGGGLYGGPAGQYSTQGESKKKSSTGKTIAIIAIVIAVIVVLVLVIFLAFPSSKDEGSDSTTSTESSAESDSDDGSDSGSDVISQLESYGTFEETTVSGSGDDSVELPVTGMPMLMEIVHDGEGYFEMMMYDDDGEYVWGCYNNGPCDDVMTDFMSESGLTDNSYEYTATTLEITADGNWSITFKPMSSMEELVSGQTYEGSAVLYIDSDSADGLDLEIRNESDEYFNVYAETMDDCGYIVNEDGDYEGSWHLDDTQMILEINSDGEWSITYEGSSTEV